MIDQPFRKLVEALSARTPTPGGGAAAALAACLGNALFLMVVRFSRGKKANAAREDELADVEATLDRYLARLLSMVQRDCNAFDLVSTAYQMPKDTPEQTSLRERAIEEAMIGAMVVPEEMQCMVRDVFKAVARVLDCVGKNIASDLASGSALLRAAAEGAMLNVQINASYLKDRELADRTTARGRAVRSEVRDLAEAIAKRVEQMIG